MSYNNASLFFTKEIASGKLAWQSPSNIALVKYWGKTLVQIPRNPSLSFTLKKSHTNTRIEYVPASSGEMKIDFFLDNQENPEFGKKTKVFFESLVDIFPFVRQLDFKIYSENTFPHSAGIASSASGMSALALILCDLERKHFGSLDEDAEFYRKASYIARLGSGSACRSVYGGLVDWGQTEALPGSSDLYGIPVTEDIHPDFLSYQDTVLLVNTSQKKVSSRMGHSLMNHNPFAGERFQQAQSHLKQLIEIMKVGDLDAFIKITESEALTLHAMMMTSQPYFLLMKANTLNIIERLFVFRQEKHIPISFTLDAGPNVHLLYPLSVKKEVMHWINSELMEFIDPMGFIDDEVGNGPEKIA